MRVNSICPGSNKGTPVAVIPHYTLPSSQSSEWRRRNCQLPVSGYGAVGPAPRFAVIFAPSGSEVGCPFRIHGIPVPGLLFMPIPTLVIIYGAAGGELTCVHSVCGGGGRVDRDNRVIFNIQCRSEKGYCREAWGGPRRGGTVSQKICRALSVNAKRNMSMGNQRDLTVCYQSSRGRLTAVHQPCLFLPHPPCPFRPSYRGRSSLCFQCAKLRRQRRRA